jgi:hypothetical protein
MKQFGLVLVALIVSLGMWGFSVHSVHAAGAGAYTYTQTDKNVQEVTADFNPCTGATGTLYLTYNDIFHVTALANGTDWFTGMLRGSFLFVPDDSAQPSYSGHFTQWFNENDNLQNGNSTFTFSVHGIGSDGSTINFHEVGHVSVSATGVRVSFDQATCA